MIGYIIAFIMDVILMFYLAFTVYEWNGVWVIEGILSGIGFWLAGEIWTRKKGDKK